MTDFLTVFGSITVAVTIVGIGIIIFAAYKISQEKQALADQEREELDRQEAEEAAQAQAEEFEKMELERQKREEEIARQRAKAQEEEERKRQTKCCICNKCSMGALFCQNCVDRASALEREQPIREKNYLDLCDIRRNTIHNIILFEYEDVKEYHKLRLLTIAQIMKKKYCVLNADQKVHDFLIDLAEQPSPVEEDFTKKYSLDKNPQIQEETSSLKWAQKLKEYDQAQTEKKEMPGNAQTEKEDFTDYRQKFPKNFRCADGLEVRSKSEREIANFFFENDIKYIYEPEYQHPYTKQTAFPDFYLPKYNLYIEYFGCADQSYMENREHKIKMYRSDRTIKFAYLTYEDDYDLTGKLKEICRKNKIPLKQ